MKGVVGLRGAFRHSGPRIEPRFVPVAVAVEEGHNLFPVLTFLSVLG